MTALLESSRPKTTPTAEQPAPVTAQQPPEVPSGPSRVLPSDLLALTVWLTGAAIIGFLLLKDLLFALW